MEITPQKQCSMLSDMMRIRAFEEEVRKLFANNQIPGMVHTYIGEEAVAVGVCAALSEDDYITSTHRGHGHCLAKGMGMKQMFAELMGKQDGYSAGHGGSMHIAEFSKGVLGANGIVGGGIPIAAGAGLSAQILKNNRVAVSFFGDAAIAQGSFHESINIAAVWKLPVVFVCENNQYGEFTHYTTQHGIKRLSDAALAYGIPGESVDGMDVIAVYKATNRAVERARQGSGPTLLEIVTHRFVGHYEGDPEAYRTEEQIEEARKLDSIAKLQKMLLEVGTITEQDITLMKHQVANEVREAVAFAERSPLPPIESAVEGVFCA